MEKLKNSNIHEWNLCRLQGNRGGWGDFKDLLRPDHCDEVQQNPEWALHLHGRVSLAG